jgi:hypothetical protein
MSEDVGPIYEVTLSIDREIIDDLDVWLTNHVEEMLQIPGFVRASIFAAEDDDQGRPQRVTHYYLESDADLEHYLAGPAELMRQSANERFAGRFTASRRVLRNAEIIDGTLKPIENCLNCGTALGGQYCGNCGQRSRTRLISIWELLRDSFGDLLELDSRIWRTLIPLITRPGKLTRDYLEGRRARYMPPFRTYLVLSIIFFLVAFFDPRQELGILFEPQEETAQVGEEDDQDAADVRSETAQDLAEGRVIVGDQSGPGESIRSSITDDEADGPDDSEEDETSAGEGGINISLSDGDTDGDCDIEDIENADIPQWLASRITKERLQIVCERVIANDGKAFLSKLLDNVPAALFILLPLMALILKVLYPLSKRYYVEHLLFVIHFHAFFFLILILQIIFSRIGILLGLAESAIDITIFAVALYVPVYLYKSIRRVYGQRHIITIPKFLILFLAYFFGFSFILLFAALFAAFSI